MKPKTKREKQLVEAAIKALNEANLSEMAMRQSDVVEKGDASYEDSIGDLEELEPEFAALGIEMIFSEE